MDGVRKSCPVLISMLSVSSCVDQLWLIEAVIYRCPHFSSLVAKNRSLCLELALAVLTVRQHEISLQRGSAGTRSRNNRVVGQLLMAG